MTETLNQTMQTFCKAKAIMTYLASDDPCIDIAVSRYENWALAYDLLVSISDLGLQEIEKVWQEKTQTQFVLWNAICDASTDDILEYITEEYEVQVTTVEQILELQNGKTLEEI
ncbi:hypothetical protein [Acinetobacter sp. YH01009]|uniref:hypothetical protein n=1 Tax=Acinetobacter TaxID=469 RepID=UPI0015D14525|nr:hypothetical protein [Acinetobacter sp. YH01009]